MNGDAILFGSGPEGALWDVRTGPAFEAFLERAVPPGAQDSVRANCVAILAKGQPPDSLGERTGLVLGRVQSGKTMSFTGVTALAHDNSVPLVIVLAGTKNNLVGQTHSRLQRDLGLHGGRALFAAWRTVAFGPTTPEPALGDALRSALSIEAARGAPTVLVTLLKQTRSGNQRPDQGIDKLSTIISRLDRNLRDALERRLVLIIDDEADEASLDASTNNRPPTPTYRAIRRLRSLLPCNTYLQYTATPQAVLLLSLLDQLSPDFVHPVPPGADYVGGEDFFTGQTPNILLRPIPAAEAAQARAAQPQAAPPATLREAILTFYGSAALELLVRPEADWPDNRSMLVHPDVRRAAHTQFVTWVRQIKSNIEDVLNLDDSDPDVADLANEVDGILRDLAGPLGVVAPSFADVRDPLRQLLGSTEILSMNSDSPEEPNWQERYAIIAVGGNKLQRGYTLNGLTVTWMTRSPGQFQADTILQRGRFFGYRRTYLPFCRVFVPADLQQAFEAIVPHETALWDALTEQSTVTTLRDWRRLMLLDPVMRPCRNSVVRLNVLRGAYGVRPLWFEQQRFDADFTDHNAALRSNFLASINQWNDWPNSATWTDPQRARFTILPLRDVINELLTAWRVVDTEVPRLSGLLFQLANAVDARDDEPCVLIQMNYLAHPSRGIDDDGQVTNLRQGRQQRYPGDRALFNPPGEQIVDDWNGLTSIQVYEFRLTHDGANVAEGVPFIAVRPAARLGQAWLSAQ